MIFRNPCKKCIVQPMCKQQINCVDYLNYERNSTSRELFTTLLTFVIWLSVAGGSLSFLYYKFPNVCSHPLYMATHMFISIIVIYLHTSKDIRKEYREDRERLFNE